MLSWGPTFSFMGYSITHGTPYLHPMRPHPLTHGTSLQRCLHPVGLNPLTHGTPPEVLTSVGPHPLSHGTSLSRCLHLVDPLQRCLGAFRRPHRLRCEPSDAHVMLCTSGMGMGMDMFPWKHGQEHENMAWVWKCCSSSVAPAVVAPAVLLWWWLVQ